MSTTNRLPSFSTLQNSLGIIVFSVLLGAVIAIITAGYEFAFIHLSVYWQALTEHLSQQLSQQLPQWISINQSLIYATGPFLAVPFIYLLINRIPEKRQHNPADLITGIHTNQGKINASACVLGAVASIFSIGLGFSVGHYVPSVQLGAGIGYWAHKVKWIHPQFVHISLGAGAAAAIAALFHAPLAAVLFVHEVLFRFFSVRAFAPITIAAVTAYTISHYFFERTIVFDMGAAFTPIPSHYLFAAIAGAVAALVGIFLIRSILHVQRFCHQRQISHVRQLLIAASITALIIAFYPQIAGVNTSAQQQIIQAELTLVSILLVLFVLKFIATVAAIGFGVPGGIFGGAIFIGLALGGLLVTLVNTYSPYQIQDPQILILTTMAAMLSSVLGAPITMIVITIELTGNFHIISVVMIAVVIANIVSFRFMGTSSYFDVLLKSRGFDVDAGRDQRYAETHSIYSLISHDQLSIDQATSLKQAETQMADNNAETAFVIDEDNNLLGELHFLDLKLFQLDHPDDTDLVAATNPADNHLYPTTSVWQALQAMKKTNAPFLPIVDGENNPVLLGVLHQQALFDYYFDMLTMLRDQENATQKSPSD
ncbi:chloride channel protein [Ostreibacterium oceani]|uniref:CBS domain-containing protein n=1 Tax=Ostreibacterium oceani TaxID=2654998 RepID=A0A6N7ERP5_9GAMM|nr:chloride channel protein [Ostreibacterium oceani]MPV85211.1 CBS domain-containing protein [Ostreibacterium oceani]